MTEQNDDARRALDEGLPSSIGRYRVLCELGTGAMATVYLGRRVGVGGFERLVAIKILHPHLCRQQGFVELFVNEARIAAAIHHPNVVAVHEIDTHGGRHYFAMDYVSGETLGQVLEFAWRGGEGSFSIELGAFIGASVADGLHASHELEDAEGRRLEVIHRDVAPQNIMVGYDGIVRVMDFGIAKALDRVGATRPGTWRGTLPYMAPEQVRGRAIDRRVDIFGLGVVLWELCVGERLFKCDTELGTVARILHMVVPAPSSRRAEVPPALDIIILRALHRDPDLRYRTARELADDLRAFASTTGRAVISSDVSDFMKGLFTERFAKRVTMERHASARMIPARVDGVDDRAPKTRELRVTPAAEAEPIDDPKIAREMLDSGIHEVLRVERSASGDAPPRRFAWARKHRRLVGLAVLLVAGGVVLAWMGFEPNRTAPNPQREKTSRQTSAEDDRFGDAATAIATATATDAIRIREGERALEPLEGPAMKSARRTQSVKKLRREDARRRTRPPLLFEGSDL